MLNEVKGKLIISCQALPDEPLHSPFIMGRMALAATMGGASGIRAQGMADILEIKKNTNLPIIGIVKRNYDDSEIYITPTKKEVDELFDDIERLKPDISGKELNVAITKLKINDLKNEIDDLDMNSSLYKDKMLDLTKLEDEIDSLTADIVRFENEREGIINSYSNLLIRRYLNDDVNIDLSKLEEILIKKIKTMEISEYLTSLLELCLKNKTA